MDTSPWVGVILDSDIFILEMDPDAECVSINRPVTIMIDSNTSRSAYVIIKLLQGKLSNITYSNALMKYTFKRLF